MIGPDQAGAAFSVLNSLLLDFENFVKRKSINAG